MFSTCASNRSTNSAEKGSTLQENISSSSSVINRLLRLDCWEVSCSAGDFLPSSGSGFDACTSSLPTCNELFCAACKTSAGGLRNLFCASFSLSLSSSGPLRELFSVASSLTPSSCGGCFVDLFSLACLEVSCSVGDFLHNLSCASFSLTLSSGGALHELFSAASSLTPSCGGRLVDLFSPACCLCCSGGLGYLFCPVSSARTSCCGGGLGYLFCPVSSGGTSVNGSILNSNVSPSSTILHRRELNSSNSLLPNALSFRNPSSETRCLGEICTSFGEYRVHFVF